MIYLLVVEAGPAAADFLTAPHYEAGPQPIAITRGDFNGDGIADLAVVNYSSSPFANMVSILLGKGNGVFQDTGVRYPAGGGASNTPDSIGVGDFNGDGVLDIVLAHGGGFKGESGGIYLLLGNGDGTFQAPQDRIVGFSPYSLAIGDFNGDGRLDLALSNSALEGAIVILLGNGDGTFQAIANYPVAGGAGCLATGDFNRDGQLDFAMTGREGLAIFLGRGDGTFQEPQNYALDAPAFITDGSGFIVAGDFNGNGLLDLAVATSIHDEEGVVAVLRGNGDGTFQPATIFDAGQRFAPPRQLVVGDFNGDGRADLAVIGSAGLSVLLSRPDGTFHDADYYNAGTAFAVAVGEFNGDGQLDLAVADVAHNAVFVLLGQVEGTFLAARNYPGTAVAIGDFNGDGIPDLLQVFLDASVLLGKGDGSFQPGPSSSISAGVGLTSLAVGDFNGDGKLDFVTTNFQYYSPRIGRISIVENDVRVFLGNGDGTFQAPSVLTAGFGPASVAVGDFNGDGIPDLVVTNAGSSFQQGSTVTIFLGNGDGTFQNRGELYAGGTTPSSVVVGDFNGDGIPDLAVANRGTYYDFRDGNVSVLLGNGDGTFQFSARYASELNGQMQALAQGDLNGDGVLDLLVVDYNHGTVNVLLGNGDGTFQSPLTFFAGSNPVAVALGDFNRDGHLDVVVANTHQSDYLVSVSLLYGNGDGSLQAPQDYPTAVFPHALAVGDFNNDGFPDVAVGTNSVTTILLNTGR